jgi:hypothetical protein
LVPGDAKAPLEHAPVLDLSMVLTDRFGSLEELLAYADGPSLNPKVKREEIVLKSNEYGFTFKAISNEWSMKKKEK